MTREEQILSLATSVTATAATLCRSNYASYDDCVQAGWIGAICAVDHYDPTRGTLKTYASARIKGAILDAFRQNDFLGRIHRKHLQAAKQQAEKHYELTGEEIGCPTITHQTLDVPLARQDPAFKAVEDRLTVSQLLALTALKPRWAAVLFWYYYKDITSAKIGKRLCINESRVSQIRRFTENKLRQGARHDEVRNKLYRYSA